MMKLEQLRQEETSSGYGSRESLAEGVILTNKQNDVAVQQPNNYCCKRSGHNRKTSLSKGTLSPHCTTMTSDLENTVKKSHRHSHSSLISSSIENKPDNSVKKTHRHSHSSLAPSLDNEMVSYVKKSHRHSHSSLAPTLDNEMENCVKKMHRNSHSSLTPSLDNEAVKDSVQKSHKHSHSSLTPVLGNQTLTHINDDLVLKNKSLMDENCRLLEELQGLTRFYQRTLNDLNIQLSAGESKIMILQETICTYKEALTNSKDDTLKVAHDKEESSNTEPLKEQESIESHIQVEKNEHKCLNYENISEQTKVMSIKKCRKRSDSTEARKRSLKSSSSSSMLSTKSESGVKSRTSLLQGRNFTKMKEKLVEKNQSLKTDIALLKVKVNMPDTSNDTLVPLQIEEVKPASDNIQVESKENVPLKKNKLLTSEVSGKRCHNKDSNRSEKRCNKSNKNKVEETNKKVFITQLQREGTLTLEEHKEKLSHKYIATSDHSTKEEVERTQKSSVNDDAQISTS